MSWGTDEQEYVPWLIGNESVLVMNEQTGTGMNERHVSPAPTDVGAREHRLLLVCHLRLLFNSC